MTLKSMRLVPLWVALIVFITLAMYALQNTDQHQIRLGGYRQKTQQTQQPQSEPPTKPQAAQPSQETQVAHRVDPECADFPDTSNVLILLKTGASEIYRRIPMHYMSMLKCMPDNVLLFSDLAQTVGGHIVYDSLDNVLPAVKQHNNDFLLYHRQQQCHISREECNKNYDTGSEGWNLDKYKNSHIAEKAWKMHPNYDWYFYIDADTYVSWRNLMSWLKTVDPTKPHYIGGIQRSGYFPFAHGGTGYLLSQVTMRDLFAKEPKLGNKWDERVSRHCCGDIMWAEIMLNETGLEPEEMFPALNPKKANTVKYSDKQWCQPIITLHKLLTEDVDLMYTFENSVVKSGNALKFKDLYHHFVKDNLREVLADWDNASDDEFYIDPKIDPGDRNQDEWRELPNRIKKDNLSPVEKEAWKSHTNCKKACESHDDCLQWRYLNGVCGIGREILYGVSAKKEDDNAKRTYSGWRLETIKNFVDKQASCEKPWEWPVKDF